MEYLGIPFSVKNTPCLQPDFLPFAPWRTAYLSQARQPSASPWRGAAPWCMRHASVAGACRSAVSGAHRQAAAVERRSWRVTLQGDEALISQLRESFSPHGSRAFDVAMMETVYGRPFCVEYGLNIIMYS